MGTLESLGLLYGTVSLMPYTAAWRTGFETTSADLCPVLAPWSCLIEHVGSTAVPQLPAKPILDVAIGVPARSHIPAVVAVLQGEGYIYRGDAGSTGGHILVRESSPSVRTHHLHVVPLSDPQWSDYLLLRDFLRADTEGRAAYATVKSELALAHAADRQAYTRAKAALIRQLLDRAQVVLGVRQPRASRNVIES